METLRLINLHINKLTRNDDYRQELILRHLEGLPVSEFPSYLQSLESNNNKYHKNKEVIWDFLKNPISDKLANILVLFSNTEQKVICMLALGYEIDEISLDLGISKVRVHQMLGSIRASKEWDKIWHSNEN